MEGTQRQCGISNSWLDQIRIEPFFGKFLQLLTTKETICHSSPTQSHTQAPRQAPSQAPSQAPTHHSRDLQSSTSSVSPALVSHHQPNARAPDILSKEFSIVTLLLVLPSVVRRDLSRVVWNRVHLKYANASPSLPDLNCFQVFFL